MTSSFSYFVFTEKECVPTDSIFPMVIVAPPTTTRGKVAVMAATVALVVVHTAAAIAANVALLPTSTLINPIQAILKVATMALLLTSPLTLDALHNTPNTAAPLNIPFRTVVSSLHLLNNLFTTLHKVFRPRDLRRACRLVSKAMVNRPLRMVNPLMPMVNSKVVSVPLVLIPINLVLPSRRISSSMLRSRHLHTHRKESLHRDPHSSLLQTPIIPKARVTELLLLMQATDRKSVV